MARTGESHAVFVVQRSFRRVRKGYDPDEVERHLQLVSEWFTKTHAGEAAREYEQSHRERLEAGATLEGARLKAEAMAREAEAELARARQEAAGIGDQAKLDAAAAETIEAGAEQARRPRGRRSGGPRGGRGGPSGPRGGRPPGAGRPPGPPPRRRPSTRSPALARPPSGRSPPRARRQSSSSPPCAPKRPRRPGPCAPRPSASCSPTWSAAIARPTASSTPPAASAGAPTPTERSDARFACPDIGARGGPEEGADGLALRSLTTLSSVGRGRHHGVWTGPPGERRRSPACRTRARRAVRPRSVDELQVLLRGQRSAADMDEHGRGVLRRHRPGTPGPARQRHGQRRRGPRER